MSSLHFFFHWLQESLHLMVVMVPRFPSVGCKQVKYSDGSPLPVGGGVSSTGDGLYCQDRFPSAQSPGLSHLQAGHRKASRKQSYAYLVPLAEKGPRMLAVSGCAGPSKRDPQ